MKKIPFEFVLDELAPIEPYTRPMFGCLAVYREETMLLVLRERPTRQQDNGVWVTIVAEHHAAVKKEFPALRPIEMFSGKTTTWLMLPADHRDFEESVFRLCECLRRGDPRFGKIPKAKRPAKKKKKKAVSRTRSLPAACR
jgi:hypothetical protein